MIDRTHDLTITRQAELLGMSRVPEEAQARVGQALDRLMAAELAVDIAGQLQLVE